MRFDINESKTVEGYNYYGFRLCTKEFKKEEGNRDLNNFISKYDADNFIDIEWDDISIGNLLKIKRNEYSKDNPYKKNVYRVEDKIISESRNSKGDKYGSLFIQPITRRAKPIVLIFTIHNRYNFFKTNTCQFRCDKLTDKMKKVAKKGVVHNHPLITNKVDCKKKENLSTVKIVPDEYICEYFEVNSPGLSISKV